MDGWANWIFSRSLHVSQMRWQVAPCALNTPCKRCNEVHGTIRRIYFGAADSCSMFVLFSTDLFFACCVAQDTLLTGASLIILSKRVELLQFEVSFVGMYRVCHCAHVAYLRLCCGAQKEKERALHVIRNPLGSLMLIYKHWYASSRELCDSVMSFQTARAELAGGR